MNSQKNEISKTIKSQKRMKKKKILRTQKYQNSINVSVGQCQSQTISGPS